MVSTNRYTCNLWPVVSGLFRATTFEAETSEELESRFRALAGLDELADGMNPYVYARFGTPNSDSVESALLDYEHGAKAALVLPSGMSAIFTTIFSLLKPGQVVLYTNPIYGCTDELLRTILAKWGLESVCIDTSDLQAVSKAVDACGERLGMILIESPSNPVIRLSDIAEICSIAKNKSATVRIVVDNTFLGPIFQRPFKHGADIVIYSATKFLGGHSDVLGGVIFTADTQTMEEIYHYRCITGSVMSPDVCWLLERSLDTLELRMNQAANTANAIASVLSLHPVVERVYYPGLLSERNDSEQFAIYQKQCLGSGSMISFYIHGGKEVAFSFQNALQKFRIAVSLGGTHSLTEHPDTTSHIAVPGEVKVEAGITGSLLRLSVGTEPTDVLMADIVQALDKVK